MFSKFVSSVSSNIYKTYDVQPNPKFHSGPWAVYDATRRASSTPRPAHQSQVSVFVFEKKSLDQSSSSFRGEKSSKAKNEMVFARLKKEVSLLSRLRHPCLLEVVEPVEESRGSLTFVTERVISSLQGLVGGGGPNVDEEGGYSDSGSSSSRGTGGRLKGAGELDELEIQSGLSSLTKALQFLHESAMIVHSNLTPHAIYINAKGDWKIGGFGFGVSTKAEPGGDSEYEFPEYDARLPKTVQRNLDFLAPEYVLDEKVDNACDMFSLGCIIVAIHQKGRSPINSNQSVHTYRQQVAKLDSLISSSRIPQYLHDTLRQLLTRHPEDRLPASAFQHSPLFDNILMNSIKFLDSFPEKSKNEKNAFLRGFVGILPQFSDRIRQRKILPALLGYVQDTDLLPLLLPNIFAITKNMSQLTFSERVLPTARDIINMKDLPDNVTITLLDSIPHLKEKTTGKEFADDIMPLVYNALGSGSFLQEKALKISGGLVDHLDFITVKSALFPKVAGVFTHTTTLGTKIATLECFLQLVPKLDAFTMTEKLIPLLRNIKTKEPSVALAAVSVYEAMGKKLGHDIVASDILPALWPMSVGVLLNIQQFNRLLAVIKEMENKVVQQQTQKLQELGPTPNASKSILSPMEDNSTLGPMEETTLDFENLVLGKKTSPQVNNISKTPVSPPISTFQTQPLRAQPYQPNPSSRPATPMSLMQPMQPTTSSTTAAPSLASAAFLTPSTAFYPSLQPSSQSTSFTGPTRNNGVFPASQAFPSATSPFSANPWAAAPANSSFTTSGTVPTIAPPPAKPVIPSFAGTQGQQPAKPAQGDGLDKYQSLL